MLKIVKKYLVDSQIFVSLMGTLLGVFFCYSKNQNISLSFLIIVFITYINGYLYTKYQSPHYFKKIVIINVILGSIGLFLLLKEDYTYLFRWFFIIGIGLLYNSYFLSKIIRKIPLVKVFYVGFTWALLYAWFLMGRFNWEVFMIAWLFITGLVLPFDIRDMKQDDVVTFPKIIGIQNTKYLAYILLFLSAVVATKYLNLMYSFSFFLAIMVSYVMIYYANEDRADSYYSFGIELCVGLPFLFLILLNYF